MSFSERYGYHPPKLVQKDGIDLALRNRLWSILERKFYDVMDSQENVDILIDFMERSTDRFFKATAGSELAHYDSHVSLVKDWFFKCNWFSVYDYFEWVLQNSPDFVRKLIVDSANEILKEEKSAWRLSGSTVVPIVDDVELNAIEAAIDAPFAAARTHIESAVSLFAAKTNPDYRNAIKEAITAVESAASEIACEKATLGKALRLIEQKHTIHPALKDAFDKLYG